jgi:hypothetical protein
MTRLFTMIGLFLCAAVIASCAIGMDHSYASTQGEQDAKVILQGMHSAPLHPGDAPVDISEE